MRNWTSRTHSLHRVPQICARARLHHCICTGNSPQGTFNVGNRLYLLCFFRLRSWLLSQEKRRNRLALKPVTNFSVAPPHAVPKRPKKNQQSRWKEAGFIPPRKRSLKGAGWKPAVPVSRFQALGVRAIAAIAKVGLVFQHLDASPLIAQRHHRLPHLHSAVDHSSSPRAQQVESSAHADED